MMTCLSQCVPGIDDALLSMSPCLGIRLHLEKAPGRWPITNGPFGAKLGHSIMFV